MSKYGVVMFFDRRPVILSGKDRKEISQKSSEFGEFIVVHMFNTEVDAKVHLAWINQPVIYNNV